MSALEEEFENLLGAYALDAVSDDERAAVEEYLELNPRARQEVHEHREVAALLAWTGMPAPAGVWDRIASAVESDTAPPAPAPVPRFDVQARRSFRPAWRTWVPAWSMAAALSVVAVVAAISFVDDSTRSPGSPLAAAVAEARDARGTKVANLRSEGSDIVVEALVDKEGRGFLVGRDLPALGDDRTYQLWGVIGDQVISLGVLGPTPEIEVFSTGGSPVSDLVVTIERGDGVVSDGNPEGAYAGSLN